MLLVLLFVCINVSGDSIKETKELPSVCFDGNILYVGGLGPNNYTKIQDAIDDAYDGDTVFVYNGIYQESLDVTKLWRNNEQKQIIIRRTKRA